MEQNRTSCLLIIFVIAAIGFYFFYANQRAVIQEELEEARKVRVPVHEVIEILSEEELTEEDLLQQEAIFFELTLKQVIALKKEYDLDHLGFEEFHSFLNTLNAEAEGFDFSLAGVANVILKEGNGLITRDEKGRLTLSYDNYEKSV